MREGQPKKEGGQCPLPIPPGDIIQSAPNVPYFTALFAPSHRLFLSPPLRFPLQTLFPYSSPLLLSRGSVHKVRQGRNTFGRSSLSEAANSGVYLEKLESIVNCPRREMEAGTARPEGNASAGSAPEESKPPVERVVCDSPIRACY